MRSEWSAGFIVALLLLCTAGRARGEPCVLALNSALVMQPDTGLVAARIDDMPVQFMLDTGSFSTVLMPDAVKRLKLHADLDKSGYFRGQPDEHVRMVGIGGARLSDLVIARSFDLGALHGHNFHFLTGNVGLTNADGLLSTDFLHEYDIDLDRAGQQIRLYRAFGACGRPKVFLEPPLYVVPLITADDDDRPRVKIIVDGQILTALIDTGAAHTVMFPRAAARLGVRLGQLGEDGRTTLSGIGPAKEAGLTHVFNEMTIGDLTIRHKAMVVAAENVPDATDSIDVLLGADFQRMMHLWVSNSSKSLVIQFPAKPSPPIP